MSAAAPSGGVHPYVPHYVIDIVVPVYNAADDLRRCVDSVLTHLRPDVRLVLIDDASPDPRVAACFADYERLAHPQLVLLRNEVNLGFTGTANRGMQLSRADVVLLNSDTIVTSGWLEAIMHCAATDSSIGTITPFSNNAEICSFPRFCEDNRWPPGADPERVRDALHACAVPTYPDLPTGVGFCMYLRRALLDDVGVFDMAFGQGYGEENDLCLRAARSGWRNVLADNAFVVHAGGQSFAGQKGELGARNMALLLDRHPHYLDMVRDYIAADPLRPLRDVATMCEAVQLTPGRGVLHVLHHHGGGTETHVRALIHDSRDRWRHYLAIAVGDRWQVEEHRADHRVITFDLARHPDESWPEFVGGIYTTFGIALVHLHNISACREGIVEALPALRVPYGYTVHDLNFACPTITFHGADGMYCGAQTDNAVCSRCLAAQRDFGRVDIAAWRDRHHALLRRAAFLIAPSQWAADTLRRYFADCPATVIAHGSPDGLPARLPGVRTTVMLPDDDVPTVALLGAVGPDKGARRIERLAELARDRSAAVRFVLIGYMDVQHGPWQSDDAVFTVHGRYEAADLPDLLAHYRAALVLYPSAGPETFSYTLTEAWSAGRPVLVPPIGALAERVRDSDAGWVMDDAEWRDESRMLDRILALLAMLAVEGLADVSARARALPHATLAQMTQATFAWYEHAIASAATTASDAGPPLVHARLLHALGYVGWVPPRVAVSRTARADLLGRVARTAISHRHTLAGRMLFRLAPASVVARLRERLK
ncbi:MAG: glycosyltransferase [Burkholderiales bacterium]|nr:glycosyltransferase [Burkholderiales bacterium]